MSTPVVIELALSGATPRSRNRHVPRRIARVGLEDWAGPGEKSNADLVRDAVALVERLGRTPATFAQTRDVLGIRRP